MGYCPEIEELIIRERKKKARILPVDIEVRDGDKKHHG